MTTVAGQHETDTVRRARADARAQGGKVAEAMPYLPRPARRSRRPAWTSRR